MKIFNSLSQSHDEFTSDDNEIGVYVCGVTPYDTTHLGHAFTFLTYDVLVRYLRHEGYDVTYVQNVTDIDDDILRKSGELGMDWQELGRRETEQYLGDMRSLNALPFDHYTAATQHIPQVIALVQELVDGGFAYKAGGSVYFSIATDPEFGKLSRIPRAEMLPIANERGNNPDDPNKQDPLDFVLWQAAKPGEPTWDTPWGPGRPGWHIECTAMAQEYLGKTFDIHGGGYDLIFPHHEAEIAQAESATGQEPYVRYWMHAAMVDYQGEKMSKSLGNLVYVRDLIKRYSADAIRLCLLDHHYRDRWEFFDEKMPAYADLAESLKEAANARGGSGPRVGEEEFVAEFHAALDDDLDTPRAVRALQSFAQQIRDASDSGRDLEFAQHAYRQHAEVLGLTLT